MTFKEKVQKIVLEMEKGNLQEIVKVVKDKALKQILDEVPAQIEVLFNKRLKEVDKIIEQRVKEHLKENR